MCEQREKCVAMNIPTKKSLEIPRNWLVMPCKARHDFANAGVLEHIIEHAIILSILPCKNFVFPLYTASLKTIVFAGLLKRENFVFSVCQSVCPSVSLSLDSAVRPIGKMKLG